ncbi:unnamed protein product, partial [Aphanomyces euteiches]
MSVFLKMLAEDRLHVARQDVCFVAATNVDIGQVEALSDIGQVLTKDCDVFLDCPTTAQRFKSSADFVSAHRMRDSVQDFHQESRSILKRATVLIRASIAPRVE